MNENLFIINKIQEDESSIPELINKYPSILIQKEGTLKPILNLLIQVNNLKVLKHFIEYYKMNPDIKDYFGDTPLDEAIHEKKIKLVKYLLTKNKTITNKMISKIKEHAIDEPVSELAWKNLYIKLSQLKLTITGGRK